MNSQNTKFLILESTVILNGRQSCHILFEKGQPKYHLSRVWLRLVQ